MLSFGPISGTPISALPTGGGPVIVALQGLAWSASLAAASIVGLANAEGSASAAALASTETGRTWQEYVQGTQSRIALPCPSCRTWVTPEREHLTGWQGAESQVAARASGAFSCPECSEVWSQEQRNRANAGARLVHAGQSITDEGPFEGELKPTDTLGFRWSAVNNLFLTAGEIAADEWRASRAIDEENAEREMRQFVWCLPVVPDKQDETPVDAHALATRTIALPRGIVPDDAKYITAAVDLGKYLLHWIVVAWSAQARGHVVDYGRIEVASEDLGVEQALLIALREFRDLAQEGWAIGHEDGNRKQPDAAWVDSGYMTSVVYNFARESGDKFRPAIGRGAAQQRQQWYSRPTRTGSVVRHIGEGYHLNFLRSEKLRLVEIDADHWKTWVHQRLVTPLGSDGAMTLFEATPQQHLALAKHLTAEVKTEEFVTGKGVVVKWERLRRQNHWFDALYNACCAGHYVGVRLVAESKQPKKYISLGELTALGRPKVSDYTRR
jgi:phage terminase large subunit GpA-like protein